MKTIPRTIDEYLASLSAEPRTALEKLRRDIHAAAPRVEECISYQMPAFRLDGKVLVWFRAATRHCSFFPGAWAIEANKRDLGAYETRKGTVHFTPDARLPAALVRKLVKARIEDMSRPRAAGKRTSPRAGRAGGKARRSQRP